MGERAHPEDPAFQDHWTWRQRGSLIPWPCVERSPWRRGLVERYRFCQRFIRNKRALDIPCGVGWGTSMLCGASRLVGVDRSEEAIDYARQYYSRQAEFRVGGMEQLDFDAGSFDLVMCLEGIEHVPVEVAVRFVAEASRVLVRGGRIIVTSPVPNANRAPNPYHCHEYRRDELLELMDAAFTPEEVESREIATVEIVYYVGQRK